MDMIQWIIKICKTIFQMRNKTLHHNKKSNHTIAKPTKRLPKMIGKYSNPKSRYYDHDLYIAYCSKCRVNSKQVAIEKNIFILTPTLKCLLCNKPPKGGASVMVR